jgi:GTP-binding protein
VFFEGDETQDEGQYLKENRLLQTPPKATKQKGNEKAPEKEFSEEEEEEELPVLEHINVAIIGKPNVGKSTLFNSLLGSERAITSSIAGTTRDSLDVEFVRDGQKYVLVDTAGLRKKTKISNKVERYSTIRALNSLSSADVVIVVVDAGDGPTEQDTKILGLAHERGAGIVICVNKWDLIEKGHKTVKEYTDKIRDAFKFAKYAPIVFTSAISGRRCERVLSTVRDIAIERSRRIPTGQLNRVLKFAHGKATIERSRRIPTGQLNRVLKFAHGNATAPTYRGHVLKFYFGTQVATCPPRFALFFNFTRGMHFSYLRSLKNTLRDKFGFGGTDIKLVLKKR